MYDLHHFICFECGHEWEDEHSVNFRYVMDYDDAECPACHSENVDDDCDD